jgi:cytochrome d ubiquinol oxidase subunit I
MVAIGLALTALSLWHLIGWWRRRRLPSAPWFFRAVVAAAPLVGRGIDRRLGNHRGRSPALGVYDVMRTEDAVTGAAGIPVGYATLVVVYVGLIAAVAWIRRQLARVPLEIDYEAAPEALDRAG